MPHVKVGPALPDGSTLDVEIARLRDLDIASLQARSHNVFRRPSPHLPRHLLFRILAYRLQAERLGDLDVESRRLLDGVGPPEDAGKRSPISGVRRMPAGRWFGPNMTMAASPVATPTDRRYSGCWRICEPERSTSSSSTRSTA
jgi:hypothetical protein